MGLDARTALSTVSILALLLGSVPAAASPVQPIAVGDLLLEPANAVDLEARTLRFTPAAGGGYDLAVLLPAFSDDRGDRIAERDLLVLDDFPDIASVPVALPFDFPFGGAFWSSVFVDLNGTISFDRPETAAWRERDPWPDGTMRSMGAAFDARSRAGTERLIAAFWSMHELATGDLFVRADAAELVVTWEVERVTHPTAFYESAGRSLFQARLRPSGVIELVYRELAESDGIVGLFPGAGSPGTELDEIADGGDVTPAAADIVALSVTDEGSTLRFRFEMGGPVPSASSGDSAFFRVFLDFEGLRCSIFTREDGVGRSSGCGPPPRAVGARIDGATVELFLSKSLLRGADRFAWTADSSVTLGGSRKTDRVDPAPPGVASLGGPARAEIDLSRGSGPRAGNLFEVFHYPVLPTADRAEAMRFVYRSAPPQDDLAILFSDFRIDDLFNHGGSSGPVQFAIEGIGELYEEPRDGADFGSARLQGMVRVQPLGPRFAETVRDGSRTYGSYGVAMGWLTHELAHRWLAGLRFDDPAVAGAAALADGSQHWRFGLHAPSFGAPLSQLYTDPYPERSPMGGETWVANGDGTHQRRAMPFSLAPAGFSALDLYAMGVLRPAAVPPTFLLRDPVHRGGGTYEGESVPVTVADVLAVEGSRVDEAGGLGSLDLGVYLLHEAGRPPRADRVAQLTDMARQLELHFHLATAGGIRLDTRGDDPLLYPGGGDFQVRVRWRDGQGNRGVGQAVELTSDTGYFWFFDPDNVEMVVKVLDACAFSGHSWVFAGGLTNVEVELEVIETATGRTRTYVSTLGSPYQPIQDTGAFACGAAARPEVVRSRSRSARAAVPVGRIGAAPGGASCGGGADSLCLNDDRFRVDAVFRPAGGTLDIAHPVPLTDDTGFFWFFDDANVEIVIKVLDACSFANGFWVFAGGLTNVEVELTVTDTATGEQRVYRNPPSTRFQPIQDTAAFASCS